MKKNGRITWALWTAILALIVLFLALYNLESFPPTWFDEGIHLLFARKLALEGKYRFGPALGPTVLFPIAAAFRIAGVGLLSARLVMVGYLSLCLAAFYVLAHHLGGWKVATVATALFVSSPGTNLLRWGRQALGEIPATLFFLLGTLLWLKTLAKENASHRRVRLVLTGVLLGLAILTKNQFSLLLPAWLLLWVADRLYFRQAHHSDFILPILSALICVAVWYVGQRFFFPAGEQMASQNVQEWSNALSRGFFTFSPRRMLDAFKFLIGQDAFFAWVVPGVLYAALRSLQRSKEGLHWALLLAVTTVWFSWFLLLSVGWPRYAFLPLTISSILVARLFHDLTEGYCASIKEPVEGFRFEQWGLRHAGKIALMALLLIMVLRPLQGRFTEVLTSREDAPKRITAYIVEHLPPDAEIETYEPEVCFLSGYNCHLPPHSIMDASIKYVWYNSSPPSEYYNFQEYGAPYLLIGEFGRWVHLYNPETVARHYELEVSIGNYELYRVKQGR
jgi:4-amino-4-deoxy-L-arabinose transferase-like glycosyltransferase